MERNATKETKTKFRILKGFCFEVTDIFLLLNAILRLSKFCIIITHLTILTLFMMNTQYTLNTLPNSYWKQLIKKRFNKLTNISSIQLNNYLTCAYINDNICSYFKCPWSKIFLAMDKLYKLLKYFFVIAATKNEFFDLLSTEMYAILFFQNERNG